MTLSVVHFLPPGKIIRSPSIQTQVIIPSSYDFLFHQPTQFSYTFHPHSHASFPALTVLSFNLLFSSSTFDPYAVFIYWGGISGSLLEYTNCLQLTSSPLDLGTSVLS